MPLARIGQGAADEVRRSLSIGPFLTLFSTRIMRAFALTAAAGALMRRLLANGQKTGATQWDIHTTPLRFCR